MIKDYDVLVVGELNADLILTGDVMPAFGQKEKLLDEAVLTLGSSSAIFACGIARLGLRAAFAGKTGDDAFGRFVVDQLAARGVDVAGVVLDAAIPTGLSVILSREADRAILTYPGSIAALRYDEVDLAAIPRARHLHLGGYFLLDAFRPDVPRLFDAARSHGLSISLDTNYDPSEKWNGGFADVLSRTDVFLPNETELLAVTREADVDAGLDRISRRVPTVAVKLGARGALACRGSQLARADSVPVDVVDTTGAGDSFDAGFVYGYLAGWPLDRMLRLGCVCGSLSTRGLGGTTAQPSLDEALAVL